MEEMRLDYPLGVLCRVLGVSAGGFHARRSRGPSLRAQEEGRLETEIRAAHKRTRETYGPERLQRDLLANGELLGNAEDRADISSPFRYPTPSHSGNNRIH